MSNRMLRPWTNSEKVNGLSVHAERFFVRLIMVVDDHGCFYADVRLLKANLFPLLLDTIREADLLRWMAECQKAGLIVLYESSNKKYLQILQFNQRLRQKNAKYPLPTIDGHLTDIRPPEVEVEVEGKGSDPPPNFWDKEETRLRELPECMGISLKDEKWVSKNKTNESELKTFNGLLEKWGETKKTLKDYKSHFSRWKAKNPDKLKTNGTNISKAVAAIRADDLRKDPTAGNGH